MSARLACFLLLLVPPSARAADAFIDPAGLPGPLVLGGGRGTDDMVKAFFDLAGKDKAKIVVVPTAIATAGDAKTDEEVLKPFQDLEPLSVVVLHTRDPKKADDPDFVKPLTEATGVWFTNGHTDRLVNAYRGTLFEKELKKLHCARRRARRHGRRGISDGQPRIRGRRREAENWSGIAARLHHRAQGNAGRRDQGSPRARRATAAGSARRW